MAYTTIRHLPNKEFREMSNIFDEEKRLAYATKCLENNLYERVADAVLGGSLTEILNEAFEITNSVVGPWYENTDLMVPSELREGCRSTSVGDIIQIAGESYMVAGCGFTYIERG